MGRHGQARWGAAGGVWRVEVKCGVVRQARLGGAM